MQNPRILIISNNPLNDTNNNGKTLSSFFAGHPNLAQLYFVPGNVKYDVCQNFFCITDRMIINAIFSRNVGEKITGPIESDSGNKYEGAASTLQNWHLLYLIRELCWYLVKPYSQKLMAWLNDFKPEIIFFSAGNSLFAYRIVEYIKNIFGCKVIVYITDDYILPTASRDIFYRIRKKMIFKALKKVLVDSPLLTISPLMQKEYLQYLGKDSKIFANISSSWYQPEYHVTNKDIILVYAGSLQLHRDHPLISLIAAMRLYNKQHQRQLKLRIYSNTKINKHLNDQLNIEGVSEFGGYLTKNELKIVLNQANILVYVESFDKINEEKIRLSLSTKIVEYLSLKKPIIAIGPENVNSMMYLNDVALCINNEKNILSKLTELVTSPELQDKLANDAANKFLDYHDEVKIKAEFNQIIQNMYEGG